MAFTLAGVKIFSAKIRWYCILSENSVWTKYIFFILFSFWCYDHDVVSSGHLYFSPSDIASTTSS